MSEASDQGELGAATFPLVQASFELAQSSGALLIRPAIRTSNDGQTFDTPVAIGSDTRNADGTAYGTTFVNLTTATNSKQLVQPGIKAKNDDASTGARTSTTVSRGRTCRTDRTDADTTRVGIAEDETIWRSTWT